MNLDLCKKIKKLNYRVITVCTLCMFYLGLFSKVILFGPAEIHFGDYISYWTVGRIADSLGYSQIYDLALLQRVQFLTLQNSGVFNTVAQSEVFAMPVPYLSFFIIPFQFLSRIDIAISYWIWLIINMSALLGYLYFFYMKLKIVSINNPTIYYYFFLILFSFPVYINMLNGQINIWLMIYLGEFIRNLRRNNKAIAGIWLSGLIMKPQLLMLIVPILIYKRLWKVFLLFIGSSSVILLLSFYLSGVNGFQDLYNLWTKWGVGNFLNSPMGMVNWRMIALYINYFTGNAQVSFLVALIGILITLGAVIYLSKGLSNVGSQIWDISTMGIVFATLVISWHSHQHMSIVLIPLLFYISNNRIIPEKMLFLWATLTPIFWIISAILNPSIGPIFASNDIELDSFSRALAGFLINIIFIVWSYRNIRKQNLAMPKKSGVGIT